MSQPVQTVPVQIVEVGPRDGLQNEGRTLPPAVRAELIVRLLAAGVTQLEAVSFVHPVRVPQMSGAEEVLALVQPHAPRAALLGLVLNERGFTRALSAGVEHVRYSLAATDAFAGRNQNSTVQAGVALAGQLVARARAAGIRIGLVLSTSFGDPFSGRVAPARVLETAAQLAALAPDELIFADTIGAGAPRAVRELVAGALAFGVPGLRVGGHFHNTRNTGYVNALAALEAGASLLDSSVGGIGGCPFAPRATGNIATEDLAYLLREMGLETGLHLDALLDTSRWLGEQLGHEVPGMLGRAGDF